MSDKVSEEFERQWNHFQAVFEKAVSVYKGHPKASELHPAIPTYGTMPLGNEFGVLFGEGDSATGIRVSLDGASANEILEERIHQAIRRLLGI